jgi:hypothetical protein
LLTTESNIKLERCLTNLTSHYEGQGNEYGVARLKAYSMLYVALRELATDDKLISEVDKQISLFLERHTENN